ncbi:MAG: hypothetical protein PWQ57_1426 [Desulfovibrionales bacterium]|nr:hypothetical protein [Desulfovibrionales bacterium]
MLECPTMRRIVSASRRTDIPAFYADWLVNRLREGYVLAPHPHAPTPRRVSLKPQDVLGAVFWTKNPAPLLSRLDVVERFVPNLFFHLTLTGAGRGLEPRVPPAQDVLKDMAFISKRYSPAHLAWRFDPICPIPDDPPEALLERFAKLAERVRGLAATCITSFATIYNKLRRGMDQGRTPPILRPDPGQRIATFRAMDDIARTHGLVLRVCCDPDVPADLFPPGACIGPELLAPAWRSPDLGGLAKRPSRKGCACRESIDIGAYDTCPAGCAYCYATNNPQRARANHAALDPQSPMLPASAT